MNMTILNNKDKFVDFHSHILPGIDDGAKNLDISIELIKREIKHGVTTIVLTPHFYPETDDFDAFIESRQKAFEILKKEVEEQDLPIELVLGAEVKFTPKLLDLDLRKLCIAYTDYILLEFSMLHYHRWTKDVFYQIQSKGYLPIIAHAERYINLPEDALYELVNAGALVQINTGSFFKDRDTAKKIERFIKANLVHLWGTDAHSLDKRPPTFDKCKAYLDKKYKPAYLKRCMQYAQEVLNNEIPIVPDAEKVKKGLFW